MAGQRYNSGKRSYHSGSMGNEKGGGKRRHSGEDRDQYAPGPDDTVYRYLCMGRKIGSIIGRGGEIVKQLRSESQAKIRIGETVPGCEERVVTIFSGRERTKGGDGEDEEMEEVLCPAQDALFKVHDRIIADETQDEEETDGDNQQVTARLLVPADQIGCIIGKGGQIIQNMRADTGAQIRILKSDQLPPSALPNDELLQVSGEASVVRKALYHIASRLHDNPSKSQSMLFSTAPGMYQGGSQFMGPNTGNPIVGMAPLLSPFGGYKGDSGGDWSFGSSNAFLPHVRDENSVREFSMRMLCPSGLVGGVIGKGGGIIKQIRQESGAGIKVESSREEEDTIIIISCREFFEDPLSATIDAAVRLQPRCSEMTDRENGEPSYTTRLLVPTTRIGCLIGKGGAIISEMRRATRANIRIFSKENLPKVASEDDEMVQISGDLEVARNALIQVGTRLKANFFEKEGALPVFSSAVPYMPLPEEVSLSKYSGGRSDTKSHGSRGYSYSSGGSYGTLADVPPADTYGGYGSSQGGSGSGYGSYSGYMTGRSSGPGYSGQPPLSHGKHHGY